MADAIKGIKVIRQVCWGINQPDDPTFPFKLVATFRSPEFENDVHGATEEIFVRGITIEAMLQYVEKKGLRIHPRLAHLVITGPTGTLEMIDTGRSERDN